MWRTLFPVINQVKNVGLIYVVNLISSGCHELTLLLFAGSYDATSGGTQTLLCWNPRFLRVSYIGYIVKFHCSIAYSIKRSVIVPKVGDNPLKINPWRYPLAKTFFGEYILLIFLYFLIIAIRFDFWCYFTSFVWLTVLLFYNVL